MAHLRPRGTVRRTGAALAAASVLCIGAAVGPAHAAEKSVFSVMPPSAQTLLPQSAGGAAADFRTVTPVVLDEGPGSSLSGVVLTVDASRLKGVAELSLPKECSFTADPSHLHAVCSLGTVDLIGQVDLGIRALAGAKVGAHGSLVFKATADNATEDPEDAFMGTTTPVVVGNGPDLAVGDLGDLSVPPGSTSAQSPLVSNKGDRDAKGVLMYLDAQQLDGGSGLSVAGSYGNCLYHYGDPELPAAERTGVLCSFPDVTVHPGESYRVATPVGLAATAEATRGFFEYGFDLVGGELADPDAVGTKGTGPALGLSPVPAGSAASRMLAGDIDYGNNTTVSMVSTGRIVDVAAGAADVKGTVGKPVAFRGTLSNTGTVPTTPMAGAPAADVTAAELVAFPPGVKVTSLPAGCTTTDDPTVSEPPAALATGRARSGFAARLHTAEQSVPDADQGSAYLCLVQQVLQPKDSVGFDFTLTPARALDRAEGVVIAVSGDTGLDDDPSNNLADFRVSAAKAQPTAKPTPSATATASTTAPASGAASASATAATGGYLADTGGGASALPIALGGAAAVLLGAGGVLFARRRSGSHG